MPGRDYICKIFGQAATSLAAGVIARAVFYPVFSLNVSYLRNPGLDPVPNLTGIGVINYQDFVFTELDPYVIIAGTGVGANQDTFPLFLAE